MLRVTAGTIDVIVAAVGLEFLTLSVLLARASAGRLIAPLFLLLASGVCLMLALRAVLATPAPHWPGVALLAAGLLHLASLWQLVRLLGLPAAGGV